jgi:hypothetical protein
MKTEHIWDGWVLLRVMVVMVTVMIMIVDDSKLDYIYTYKYTDKRFVLGQCPIPQHLTAD